MRVLKRVIQGAMGLMILGLSTSHSQWSGVVVLVQEQKWLVGVNLPCEMRLCCRNNQPGSASVRFDRDCTSEPELLKTYLLSNRLFCLMSNDVGFIEWSWTYLAEILRVPEQTDSPPGYKKMQKLY